MCGPECRCPASHKALLTGIEGDLRKSRESENPRRRWRYVDKATAHEGTTIVDGHDHRIPIALVRYLHLRAQRQRAVGGGESFAIQFSAARGSATAFNGVDRGNTGLIRRCTREIARRKLAG